MKCRGGKGSTSYKTPMWLNNWAKLHGIKCKCMSYPLKRGGTTHYYVVQKIIGYEQFHSRSNLGFQSIRTKRKTKTHSVRIVEDMAVMLAELEMWRSTLP